MGGNKAANKAGYFDKLKGLLEEYKSIFIVEIDNVSSQQMHEIRHALRGKGVVLMGKNTMVRGGKIPWTFSFWQLGEKLEILPALFATMCLMRLWSFANASLPL